MITFPLNDKKFVPPPVNIIKLLPRHGRWKVFDFHISSRKRKSTIWADPFLSLPDMLVIGGVMGAKKTAVFCTIIVILSTIAGMIYDAIATSPFTRFSWCFGGRIMTQEDVFQIRVADYTVGIMGLKTALGELAETHGKKADRGTPARVINGRVKSVGKIPPRTKLIRWIEEANNTSASWAEGKMSCESGCAIRSLNFGEM